MARMRELSEAAAAALDNGQDPLQQPFLSEHDVTFDECYALAGRMAFGLQLADLVLAADPALVAGALHGAQLAAAYRALTRALTAMNPAPGKPVDI